MPSQNALIGMGAAGVAVVTVGAASVYWVHPAFLWPKPVPPAISDTATPTAPASAQKAPAPDRTAAAAPSAPAAPAAVKPSFDVVSVDPTGQAVVAGRAAPNVKVTLLDRGRTLAEAMTDAHGQFVVIPAPLLPGDHSLMLSTAADGTAETSNAVPVVVVAPPPKPTTVASADLPAAAAGPASAAPAEIAVQSVEASANGGMVARGKARPNATVRLYVDDAFVGDAKTRGDGRWSLTIKRGMTPGGYAVRADEVDPGDGKVVARAEAPFTIPALTAQQKQASAASSPAPVPSPSDVVVDTVQTHHVERGHTLWGISQKFYGDGSRYAVIFSANAEQIRNPNLIYPGQTFVVPKGLPKP